jgi:tetratricopeptide repeat protein
VKNALQKPRRFPLESYVFAGVFFLRLIVLCRLTSSAFLLPAHGDMHFYNDWALRIVRGQWTDHLAFYGLPLYAYLLAAIYKIFGYSPFVPAFLQACLEAGTAVLIYRLAFKLFREERPIVGDVLRYRGKIVGIVAALGWGFCQSAQAYSVILMPTSWLVFVFWLLVWQVVSRKNLPNFGAMLLFGVLVGLTAMGVATILFIVPLILGAVWCKWEARDKQSRSITAFALLIGVILGASPAFLHNAIVARDPVFLSAHSGVNLWIGNNPWANGYPHFPAGLRAGQEAMLQDSIRGAESASGHSLKRSEVSAYWSAQAKSYIAHNFGAWLKLLGLKVLNFWNAFRYDDLSVITILREEGITLPGITFGLIAALAIPGLIIACARFPLSRWVAAAIISHMVSLLGVFVTERYRLAVIPGLLVFAAFGVWEFWESCVSARFRVAVAYAALLLLATLFVSIPKRDPSLWALDSYNTGLQALDSNHLRDAERKFDLAYAYVPDNAELNFALGNLRLARGDKNGAKSYYVTTLHLDPRHEGSYNNLGVLALEEKRGKLAANCFAKALEQNPRDAKTHYLLARAYLITGNADDARNEIEKAIQLDSVQPEFRTLKETLEKKPASR